MKGILHGASLLCLLRADELFICGCLDAVLDADSMIRITQLQEVNDISPVKGTGGQTEIQSLHVDDVDD